MTWVCLDTCFLYDVYDPQEPNHRQARRLFTELFVRSKRNFLVAPWPILYETINTAFAEKTENMSKLNGDFKLLRSRECLYLIPDEDFRDDELTACFDELGRGPHYRPLSLADRVIRRLILHDRRIKMLVSRNIRDFNDVCARTGCHIASY